MRDYRFLGWDTHILADKASEAVIFIGLAIGGIVPAWLAAIALASSLGITLYGQALKRRGLVHLRRSIFDRAARIIAIVALGFLVNYTIALIVVCAMNCVLFAQRALEGFRAKKSGN
jgi:phosphatidylglycerophosphate synthase